MNERMLLILIGVSMVFAAGALSTVDFWFSVQLACFGGIGLMVASELHR
jgi:hypothetical protein